MTTEPVRFWSRWHALGAGGKKSKGKLGDLRPRANDRMKPSIRNVTRVTFETRIDPKGGGDRWYGAKVATVSRDGKRITRTDAACPTCAKLGRARPAQVAGLCRPCYQRRRRARGRVLVPATHRQRQALGRGVCSSCSTVAPLFAVGKKAKCRECLS